MEVGETSTNSVIPNEDFRLCQQLPFRFFLSFLRIRLEEKGSESLRAPPYATMKESKCNMYGSRFEDFCQIEEKGEEIYCSSKDFCIEILKQKKPKRCSLEETIGNDNHELVPI